MPMLTPPASGLDRKLRKLAWSWRRRWAPLRPVILPFDGGLKIAVRPIDRLGRRIYLDGYSEPDYATLLGALLRPGMTYVDVGAHFGQYVLMAAKRVGTSGAVHAFEPTSATFAQLEVNVRLNGFSTVVLNRLAVYDRPGEMELKVCVPGKGEFNSLGLPMRPGDEVVSVESVRATTLDDYCRQRRLWAIDLLKIDVEGAELFVVKGAAELLGRPDAPSIVCEFNERTANAMGYSCRLLRKELEGLRYRLFAFDAPRRRLFPEPERAYDERTANVVATKNPEAFQARLSEDAPE